MMACCIMLLCHGELCTHRQLVRLPAAVGDGWREDAAHACASMRTRTHCSPPCALHAAPGSRPTTPSIEEEEAIECRDAGLGSMLDQIGGSIHRRAIDVGPTQVAVGGAGSWGGGD